MLNVSVADYLIHNLSSNGYDNNDDAINSTIDMIVDSWSNHKYLNVKPRFNPKQDRVYFGSKSLRKIANC